MTKWNELYKQDCQPELDDFRSYVKSKYWDEINEFAQQSFNARQSIEYSKCSAQPGWNIKYKKSGKTLFTLYPMENFFISLIVINEKMQPETELVLSDCSDYVKNLYRNTSFLCGGKWLMIEVRDKGIMGDLVKLVHIRAKVK